MNRRTFLQYLPAFSTVPLIVPRIVPLWLTPQDDPDALLCARKFELAISASLQKKRIGQVIVEIGKSFIGTDYLANAIEQPGEERLVVNLRGLDCVSFCENALVFARCIKKNATTFEDYKKELQLLRYRDGVIDQYPSRLHYFTDYIYEGVQKGIWSDVTKDIGGKRYRKIINFMSTHSDSYRQLKENPEFVKAIQQQELEFSMRQLYYVPKGEIRAVEQKIQDGDILAITTDIGGLDVSHTGIALWQMSRGVTREGYGKQSLHMMHAPDVGYKVMITELPLAEYLAQHKRQTGIIVARAVEA